MKKARVWIALVAALGIAWAGSYEFTVGSARSFSPAINLGVFHWQGHLGYRFGLDLPAPYPVLEAGLVGRSGGFYYGLGLAGYLGDGLALALGGYLGYRWNLPGGTKLRLEYAPLFPYVLYFSEKGVKADWLPDPIGWVIFLSRVRLLLGVPLAPPPEPLVPTPEGYALGLGLPLWLEAERRARLGPRYTAWAGGAWYLWEGAVAALGGVETAIDAFHVGPYLGLAYAYRDRKNPLWLLPGARFGYRWDRVGVQLFLGSRVALPKRRAQNEVHLLLQYRLGP